MKKIYLDYAAATPVDPEVLRVMMPFWRGQFYNPSSIYLAARDARLALEQARWEVAQILGAKAGEVIFVSGATEANNLAIQGVMRLQQEAEVVLSAIEHDSVLAPAKLFAHKQVAVSKQGLVKVEAVKKAISNKTALVSVGFVNNEIGSVQPIRQLAALVAEINQIRQKRGHKLPLYLHTDASQATEFFDLHTNRLKVDLMTVSGSKIYGPRGSGVLYVRAGTKLQPVLLGGGQESGLRSGTENIANVVGLAAALSKAQSQRAAHAKNILKLHGLFVAQLKASIPSAIVNGAPDAQAPHIIHLTIPGVDNELLAMELDEKGIEVGLGSACRASDGSPSRVLSAIGLDKRLSQSSLRLSLGRPTKQADISRTVRILSNLVNKV